MSKRVRMLFAILIVPTIAICAALATCMPVLAEPTGYSSLRELDGKRIGVQTGTTFDAITKRRLPNATIEYYNSYADLVEALSSHKIDGFPSDEPVIQMIATENPKIQIMDERLEDFEFGAIFPKTDTGKALKREFDEWISKTKESGELEQMTTKWIKGPNDQKTVPNYKSLPAPKGTLTMATEGAYPPCCL